MKHTRSLTTSLVVCAVALAMITSLAAQTAVEGAAKVIRIKGSARYMTPSAGWQPLNVGAVLAPGTLVQTSNEKNACVDIVLGDVNAAVATPASYKPSIPSSMAPGYTYQPSAEQNVVRLWENTALGIDKLTTTQTGDEIVTDTQLDLKQGRISGNVKKMSAASKYEVKLPNGVAGIRGTVYDIRAEGVVQVLVGSVVVAWVDSKSGNVGTQVVMGGQQYDARTGQITPLDPQAMKGFEGTLAAMRTAGKPQPVTMASDRTIHYVSPKGPPFTPPGPPPVIPPRGQGGGPGGN